ncbi:non-homologous end-joining DNA ligase [Aquihabitans sp. McL0605]|uniref:non-homologous end-joining DNA ligase n=1 Tax=Aquihabitans sp. McL0605 TaxID=3415671 RepID=UPI003CF40F03
MAATTTDRRQFDEAWAFERKLDGFRVLAWADGEGVRLRSRNGQVYDETFAEVTAALETRAKGSLLVDGEVVVFEDGQTSFSQLQQRLGTTTSYRTGKREPARPDIAVQYVVFDLLWFDGHDIRTLPLEARQEALRDVIDWGGPLIRSEALPGDAEELLAQACKLGWEGLIAKRLASTYQPRRSKDWLKLKCTAAQEFVVGGFTEPKGARSGLGALMVGYYDGDRLRYAGKVGTGFDDATLRSLHAELAAIERPDAPFADPVREPRVHWVDPTMVVQVGFAEWTGTDHLRHPRYLGRRPDKAPTEVVREPPIA